EAVEFRRLNVEEDQVGLVRFDGGHRRQSVAAFADDRHLGVADEHIYNPLARQRLVVNNQRSDLIHRLYPSLPPEKAWSGRRLIRPCPDCSDRSRRRRRKAAPASRGCWPIRRLL